MIKSRILAGSLILAAVMTFSSIQANAQNSYTLNLRPKTEEKQIKWKKQEKAVKANIVKEKDKQVVSFNTAFYSNNDEYVSEFKTKKAVMNNPVVAKFEDTSEFMGWFNYYSSTTDSLEIETHSKYPELKTNKKGKTVLYAPAVLTKDNDIVEVDEDYDCDYPVRTESLKTDEGTIFLFYDTYATLIPTKKAYTDDHLNAGNTTAAIGLIKIVRTPKGKIKYNWVYREDWDIEIYEDDVIHFDWGDVQYPIPWDEEHFSRPVMKALEENYKQRIADGELNFKDGLDRDEAMTIKYVWMFSNSADVEDNWGINYDHEQVAETQKMLEQEIENVRTSSDFDGYEDLREKMLQDLEENLEIQKQLWAEDFARDEMQLRDIPEDAYSLKGLEYFPNLFDLSYNADFYYYLTNDFETLKKLRSLRSVDITIYSDDLDFIGEDATKYWPYLEYYEVDSESPLDHADFTFDVLRGTREWSINLRDVRKGVFESTTSTDNEWGFAGNDPEKWKMKYWTDPRDHWETDGKQSSDYLPDWWNAYPDIEILW